MATGKNVLIIHTDEQRYDSLGCTGNAHAATPNIDCLAAEGTLFTRHIAANPVCTPSRCSLLTGLYPPGHGSWGNGMALFRREYQQLGETAHWMEPPEAIISEIPTMADRFGAAGYRTASFGKLHLTPTMAHRDYGYHESIARWRAGDNDGWNGPYYGFDYVEIAEGHGEGPCRTGHYSQWLKERDEDIYNRIMAGEKAHIPGAKPFGPYQSILPYELHHSNWLAERFTDYLGAADEQPFFVFLGFPDPHLPISPCAELAREFADAEVLEAVDPAGNKRPHIHKLNDISHLSEADRKTIRRYTDAMIKGIDLAVGKIVAALEEKSILDETVVVFTSDHGDFLCDHGLMAKQNICVAPLIHVPFILRAKDAGLPRRWDEPMSNTDVLPTLMGLAGLPVPQDIDGRDIRQVMQADTAHPVYAYAYAEHPEYHNMAIYEGDFKFLYYPQIERTELYNVQDDPHEMDDLAAVPTRLEQLEDLKTAAAKALMKHTKAKGNRVCPW